MVTFSSDRLLLISSSVLIGHCDYSCLGFTTFKRYSGDRSLWAVSHTRCDKFFSKGPEKLTFVFIITIHVIILIFPEEVEKIKKTNV